MLMHEEGPERPLKVVRILGMAPNLANTPPPKPGEETWLSNSTRGYFRRLPHSKDTWTRYFNLHSVKHQKLTYPETYAWYQSLDGKRPIYFQKFDPTVPGCVVFPKETIQEHFKTGPGPQKYFTFTGAWLIALAIYEGFDRIEMWGFEVRSTKPAYAWERPCFFYWVDLARKRGIEVFLPPELDQTKDTNPGDPETYTGPLYGWETKPED